jgi:hypothetical protein
MKCKNCSYQFDPLKEGNSEKGNVECVFLEILIQFHHHDNITRDWFWQL